MWQQTRSHSAEVHWNKTRLSGIIIGLMNLCKCVTGAAGDTCTLGLTLT